MCVYVCVSMSQVKDLHPSIVFVVTARLISLGKHKVIHSGKFLFHLQILDKSENIFYSQRYQTYVLKPDLHQKKKVFIGFEPDLS